MQLTHSRNGTSSVDGIRGLESTTSGTAVLPQERHNDAKLGGVPAHASLWILIG